MSIVTRDDVAKLAGVAPATVSNVINNKNNVSSKLKDKVMQAIKELNYTPNLVARSLMTKSSKHIGLVMEDLTNPHFAEMAKGVQYEASQYGYVLSINLAARDIDQVVEDYISRRVDGIIFNAYYNFISGYIMDKLKKSRIACVCCGASNNTDLNFIGTDYYDGMVKAYTYMYNMGHRTIGYISGQNAEKKGGSFIDTRAAAYEWCCSKTDSFSINNIVFGSTPYLTDNKAGYKYCKELLGRNANITAIIAANDFMALGVLQYLREAKINIPEDMSIISFDNTVYAETSYPRLTSIGVSAFEIGRSALHNIMQQCTNEPFQKEEWFSVDITVRDTTSVSK